MTPSVALDLLTPTELLAAIGARARALRLLRDLGQAELANRAGVGVATVQRFEKTGQVSLENAYRIAVALLERLVTAYLSAWAGSDR